MDIIGLGNFTGTFAGAPTVAARHDFSPAKDLAAIQNLKITLDTTGGHGNVFVRLEVDANNYFEFDLGGAQTDTGTRSQTLSGDIRKCIRVQESGNLDVNAQNITAAYVYVVDDGNVAGTASVDAATIKLEYDEEVTNNIVLIEGYTSFVQAKITLGSTTVTTKGRVIDPNTGTEVTETLMVLSDNIEVPVYDFEDTPAQLGVLRGETFWLEKLSYDATLDIVTWTILQRGGSNVKIPPSLGSFRDSLRITTHEKSIARATIVLHKGAIEAAADRVAAIGDGILADNQTWQTTETAARVAAITAQNTNITTFQTTETAARTTFETDITAQQTAHETATENLHNNFVATQRDITGIINPSDSTKLIISGGKWLEGVIERSYAGATVTPALSQTTFYELEAGTGALINNTSGFTSGNFPILKCVTDVSGITSVINYGSSYQVGGAGGGGSIDWANCTNFVYTDGLLTSFDDPDGVTWTYTYDSDGDLLTTVHDGVTTTINRNSNGEYIGTTIS